ncbi:MAG: SH3 domain-containing protein [bacterium]|nr:SH3 domain-containing protein [bacterium]
MHARLSTIRKTRFFTRVTPLMLVLALLIGALSVSAQSGIQPLELDENTTGTLTAAAPQIEYALLIDTPTRINVRVFAITPGLAPNVRVLDTAGTQLGATSNTGNQTAVQIQALNVPVGVLRVQVSSANGQLGDFLINVEPEQQIPPTPLPLGQIVNGQVSSAAARLVYSFSGGADQGRWLFVQSLLVTGGPVVIVTDATTQETIAMSSGRVRGSRFQLPTGAVNYLVEVAYAGVGTQPAPTEAFTVCLAPENNPNACPVVGAPVTIPTLIPAPTEPVVPTLLPTQLPPLPPSNVCILGSATGGNVNVRSGPSTNFSIVTQLNGTSFANVIGRLPDNSWYLITISNVTGWISASVVRLGGPCNLVPAILPTATPTVSLATATATITPTVSSLTATPTATATVTSPSAAPTLNFGLPPVFGSTALTSGFVPDPFTVAITAGGPANVSYLGGGCTGNTTSAPSFSVTYTPGAFPLLRFYFVGSGDTTMTINAPNGSYFCNDDSFGTFSPTIDFNSPTSGRYDIWIGTFSAGASISGTLNVTENSGNRP